MEGLNIVITEEGLKKIARATIEEPLIIDRFGVGDGNGEEVELEASRTSLVNEKYRDYVNNKYTNDNNIVVECVLRGNAPIEEGFYLREIGLFDEEGILIAHAKLPEQYRPPYEEGQIITEDIFNINLRIENSENIQVNIQETIFATVDSVERLSNKVDNLSSIDIHIKNESNFPKQNNVQEALNSLYTETKNLLNISANFYKMFIGVAITQFNDINPLMNNSFIKWAWCEGQTLTVAEFPDLYSVLGNRWGGTANLDFKLPDTRNRVLRNQGADMVWGYQEDAQQKITGYFNVRSSAHLGNIYTSGVFRANNNGSSNNIFKTIGVLGSQNGDQGVSLDSSLQVRTANENRVKSLSGRTLIITKVLL